MLGRIAIFLILLTQSEVIGEGQCTDFTLDLCETTIDDILETVHDVNETICQKYCNIIYNETCEFFIYDRKQDLCLLMRQAWEDYEIKCRKVGGPPEPTLEDCILSDDPCDKFLEGYCIYEGTIIDNVKNGDDCQATCFNHQSKCAYFLYDRDSHACSLYKSAKRHCDLFRGPKSPDFEDCFDNSTIAADYNESDYELLL